VLSRKGHFLEKEVFWPKSAKRYFSEKVTFFDRKCVKFQRQKDRLTTLNLRILDGKRKIPRGRNQRTVRHPVIWSILHNCRGPISHSVSREDLISPENLSKKSLEISSLGLKRFFARFASSRKSQKIASDVSDLPRTRLSKPAHF
jgi:hypothetical protein